MPPHPAKMCPRLLTGSELSTQHQPGNTEGKTWGRGVGSATFVGATVQAQLVLSIA